MNYLQYKKSFRRVRSETLRGVSMKKLTFVCIFIMHLVFDSQCQSNLGKVWVTGGGISYKISFNLWGIQNAYLDTFYSPYFAQGNSNICDTNGNLILCSDGFNIYDSTANFIDGGDTLVNVDYYNHYTGWSPYPQTSIFFTNRQWYLLFCNTIL